jgi:predicted RNA-binding Zn ribbon-like protein
METTSTHRTSQPPAGLELVMAFENTYDVDSGQDELATPAQLADWLAGRALLDLDGPAPGEDDLAAVVQFREAVRALLLANNGEPLDPLAPATLNRIAARARLRVGFGADGRADLAPAGEGVDGALARLLAHISEAMADGTWARLKVCREDTCQWAFYDRSKNRSGSWCTMAVCGNRSKARAYRRRGRAAAASAPAAGD